MVKRGGVSDGKDLTEVPKERFPQRKTVTIGTSVALSAATSSWFNGAVLQVSTHEVTGGFFKFPPVT